MIRLTGNRHLDIEFEDGPRYFGKLVESSGDGLLCIQREAGAFEVKLNDVDASRRMSLRRDEPARRRGPRVRPHSGDVGKRG